MKNSLLKTFFSSGLQAISVQVFGVAFFVIISYYLPKNDFGIISWANAVAFVLGMLLSFGLDQVVLRRVAASDSVWPSAAYFFHSLLGSAAVFFGLLIFTFIFGAEREELKYLPWFFISQGLIFMASPFKQLLNGKQRFTPYAVISLISNLGKIVLAVILMKQNSLTIVEVYRVLIFFAAFELVCLLVYVKMRAGFLFKFKLVAYRKLLKEAFPQYIAVIFDSSLARMDWVLLGLLSTNAATADYSLAFRAYEVAKLPLAVVSPIILVRFAKMLSGSNKLPADKKEGVLQLFRVEMFVAMLLPLVLNLAWSPVLDQFFKGKYGSVNAMEFMILSVVIPFQFFINLLWTLCFASKQFKKISQIIASTAVFNVALSLLFIPFWGGIGAAISFLFTSVLMLIGFYRLVQKEIMIFPARPFFTFLAIATVSYLVASNIDVNFIVQEIVAVIVYILFSIFTKQIQKVHVQTLFQLLKK